MHFDTHFKGRIIQVTEALSFDDAVSNQVLALDQMLQGMGLRSAVYTKWHDARLEKRRQPIEELAVTEHDVIVHHLYGMAEHTLPDVLGRYCTKVLLYHNITPHDFFPTSSRLHEFCRVGRDRLGESIAGFHHFWAVSQFNLDELIALGAPPACCSVIPIIVNATVQPSADAARTPGSWIFVGRVAPNKDQCGLLQLFEEVQATAPALAQELILVGGFEADDPYYLQLREQITGSSVGDRVRLTGKVSNEERDHLLASSQVYVSLSAHEGFGVPLVEASHQRLPVAALATTAVAETLGSGAMSDRQAVKQLVLRLQTDSALRASLLEEQALNALRFASAAVEQKVQHALRQILPLAHQFKSVSVVICTYNRKNYLERVLDYLSHQSSGAFEVIVVDGPSDDGSKELLKSWMGRVKVLNNSLRNLSVSRNLGIEQADGDIVAFIDDDALPFDNWIEKILDEYNSRPLTTAGLGGPAYYAGTLKFQAEDNGVNRFAEAKPLLDGDAVGKDGWLRYNTGTNATFSVSALRAAGGFDEQFDYYLDESEVCLRLQLSGALIGYAPQVVVRHEFAQSHNRRGGLDSNWYTICKNTAYFVCAYSGLSESNCSSYLCGRMQAERIPSIEGALKAGLISQQEHDRHITAIWDGTKQGIEDARNYPRRRQLAAAPQCFIPFGIRRAAPSFSGGRRRLHICIVSKEFPPFAAGGGIGTMYYHLASELLLMGHMVTVVVPDDEDRWFAQGDMRVQFTLLNAVQVIGAADGFARNISWSISAMAKVAEIHAREPIDVIDSALWDAEALALALLPSAQRPPVVVRLVTPFAAAARINEWQISPETRALFVQAEHALMRHADAIVPISESIARSIETEYGLHRSAKWQTIPCGIAYWPFFDFKSGYDAFPDLDGVSKHVLDSKRLVLFVGRLERRKGIDLALQAAEAFLAADATAHFIVAGRDVEGWKEKSKGLLSSAIQGRVHFLGEVADATRDKLMAHAYCMLFPSRYESFGLVPLEGFVHGTPVIASRSGAIPEVVEDGVSGLLFEAESADSLAQATIRMLKDPGLRASLSAGALRRVRTLSSRNSAERSVALYNRLLDGSARGGKSHSLLEQ